MYSKELKDHYFNPRHKGVIAHPDLSLIKENALCGDIISWTLSIKHGVIEKAKFMGKGCLLSQAAASMLAEALQQKKVEDILLLQEQDILQKVGDFGPTRAQCALLSLRALQSGLTSFADR